MKTTRLKIPVILTATVFGVLMAIPPAFGQNGPALYFAIPNPAGAGYDLNGNYWSTSETGTPGPWVTGDQMTFGTNASDANYPAGTTFSILVDNVGTATSEHLQGVAVNTSNAVITLTGTANVFLETSQNWWVTNGSTLIDNDNRQGFDAGGTAALKGVNANNKGWQFVGNGILTFDTPFGCNSTVPCTNSLQSPGVANINIANNTPSGAGTYKGGFVQNSGGLNFESAGSANIFYGFTNGAYFIIYGGTVDNTSGGSGLTLNWAGGGGIQIGGNFTFNGSSSMSFGAAPVTLTTSPTITINANTLTLGGPISGAGNGLTVTGNGTLALGGTNTYTGNTYVNGATLSLAGSASINGSANVAISNATLNLSGLTSPSLSNTAISLTNATLVLAAQSAGTIETAGALNLGGTANTINITSIPPIAGYPSVYHLISYTTLNGAFNFSLGPLPFFFGTQFVGYVTNESGFVDLVLTSGPPPARRISWIGTDPSSPNNWDAGISRNWQTNGVATIFNQGDTVTFNDSATGQTNIYLTTSLLPTSVTVSNSALIYDFNGGGEISGSASLTKEGTGLLILDESGGNNFTGGLIISNGTVQVGLGDGRGSAGAGPIRDNGALIFNNSTHDSGLLNDISGLGAITTEGGDTLQLDGTNTFSGSILVASNGTLQLGGTLALEGSPVTTVPNGSVLDVNGFAAGGVVMVQGNGTGNGAVINSSANIPANDVGLTNLTLTGDTTIGITGNRFDLRSPAGTGGNPGSAVLSTGGQPYNLVKAGAGGTGVFGLVAASVDPALGNIDIQAGDLQIAGNTTGLGNPADTLTIENGAMLELYAATNQNNKVIVLNDGGTLRNASGVDTIIGPMNITNSSGSQDCYFDVAGTSLVLSNTLTGNGIIFTEIDTNTIYFNGNSPAFAGGIYMNTSSRIVVDGVLSNALTIESRLSGSELTVNGQVLGAEVGPSFPGTITGTGVLNCTVDSAAPIYPGDNGVVGTMTVNNLILDGSSITYDLGTNTTAGSGSNDLIVVTGNLTVNGGTITVNPLGLLATGSRYTLFTYAGTLALNSQFVVNNTGGYSYTIDTSTQGVVYLVISHAPPIWNGSSATDSDWSDSANWGGSTPMANDTLYFGGNTRLVDTNDIAGLVMYTNLVFLSGAGNFDLNGNPIDLSGNVQNLSTGTETVNLGLNLPGNATFNAGTGALIIGGGVTNTSTTATTLTLAGTGTLTNFLAGTVTNSVIVNATNANWTLVDNPSSLPITLPWVLLVDAGTFNFGSGSSAPNFTSTISHNLPSDDFLANTSNSVATLNMAAGTLTLTAPLDSANLLNSTGIVNQTGGTLNFNGTPYYYQGANGPNTGEVSIVTISGGTMNMGTAAAPTTGPFYVASRGNGTLTLSGSGTLNCSILDVSRNAQGNTFSSIGVVNLNGGVLVAGRVGTATANSQAGPPTNGVNPTATFNFNGGLLRAAATSATFFEGSLTNPAIPITSIVQAGGAVIDSSNFNISVLEPLKHASALGATLDGGLTKLGTGTLTLTAASTYTGPTVVSNGTLAVNGSLANTSGTTVETSGTLSGTGLLGGNVTVAAGGAVAPGGSGTNGILTVTGTVTLSGNANAEMNINATTLTNSVLSAAAIVYNGTLSVTNLSGTLALNNSFTLFKASSYSGAFTGTNLPALGPGLAWNWNPVTATLSVVSGGSFPPTVPPVIKGFSLSGLNVTISGTNAQAGATYYLLASTNLVLPLSQWTCVATNVATGANNFSFIETNAVSPSSAKQFYIMSGTNN